MINKMQVMSSQRYINWEIVEKKIEELTENHVQELIIPVVNSFTQDSDGNGMYIMTDCHHSLQAARELGIDVTFEEVEDELSYYADIEAKNGENICEAWAMDSAWYYVSTGVDVW